MSISVSVEMVTPTLLRLAQGERVEV